MVASAITRRSALVGLGASGLSLTFPAPGARAQGVLRFSAIRVNVEPLRAAMGDPTAAWMEQALLQALPQTLGPHLVPGDRSAPVLEVQIDWLYLGLNPSGGRGPGGGPGQDTIVGSFIVRGPRGGIESQIPLRAITFHLPSAVDQALPVQGNYWRVVALAQAFAGWAPRELGL